jgi:hypothetical protein
MSEFENGFRFGTEFQELRGRIDNLETVTGVGVAKVGPGKQNRLEGMEIRITTMDEESIIAETTAGVGYGYMGTVSKWVSFREANGYNFAYRNDSITVPSGTKRISVRIDAIDMSFGHDNYDDHHLGRIAYQAWPTGFSGTLVAFSVQALLRDINGDDKWEAGIKVTIDCFG